MFWTLVELLGAAIAFLAIYVWVLTRVAHGGKGWPRWRRNRRPFRAAGIVPRPPPLDAGDRSRGVL